MPDGTQLLVTSKNNCNSVVDMRTQKIVKQKTSQEEVGSGRSAFVGKCRFCVCSLGPYVLHTSVCCLKCTPHPTRFLTQLRCA